MLFRKLPFLIETYEIPTDKKSAHDNFAGSLKYTYQHRTNVGGNGTWDQPDKETTERAKIDYSSS
jgi:hypothetical protein